MLLRSIFTLLLLLPPSASLAEPEPSLSALVKISGRRGDQVVTGTGFVVGIDRSKATIVTAGHVIAGLERFTVSFEVDPGGQYIVGSQSVLGMESDSQRGAGVFQVRGALPEGVISLSFDTKPNLKRGDEVVIAGFRDPAPQILHKPYAGSDGNFLLLSSKIANGFSGSPVLRQGYVIGIVVAEDGQNTLAIKSIVAEDAVKGWGAKIGGNTLGLGHSATVPLSYLGEGEKMTIGFFYGMFQGCFPTVWPDAAGFEFVEICPWSPTVNSPKNADGTRERTFWIGAAEITNQQYRRFRPNHPGEAALPVTQAGWADAKAFCEHFGARLPKAAESEYAARESVEIARLLGEEVKGGSVAKREISPLGFYYIRGKVAEWVADRYGSYSGAPQAAPPPPVGDKAQGAGRTLPMPISFRCVKNNE